jgi:hypothetical protein
MVRLEIGSCRAGALLSRETKCNRNLYIESPEMSRIPFNSDGKDICPVCYLRQMSDLAGVAACGIAIGSVSAVIADSPGELGELIASACAPHQQRIAQFVYACSQLSGLDSRKVFERLGARPAGPQPEGTLIHLAKDDKTRCGQRRLEDKWPDNERFVYQDKAHLVNCTACLEHP